MQWPETGPIVALRVHWEVEHADRLVLLRERQAEVAS